MARSRNRYAPSGRCDACGVLFVRDEDGELDHWAGRVGAASHHPDNGWRLCRACHFNKTNNMPFVGYWNNVRHAYCQDVGVPFNPRRER